jgi:hypothetical protein
MHQSALDTAKIITGFVIFRDNEHIPGEGVFAIDQKLECGYEIADADQIHPSVREKRGAKVIHDPVPVCQCVGKLK